jgi:hypothetical protein
MKLVLPVLQFFTLKLTVQTGEASNMPNTEYKDYKLILKVQLFLIPATDEAEQSAQGSSHFTLKKKIPRQASEHSDKFKHLTVDLNL